MSTTQPISWQHALDQALPIFGHRNWIVVADSAYPQQVSPGITTVQAHVEAIDVVSAVLHRVDSYGHVSARVYIDSEMRYLDEADAPGATKLRNELHALLGPHVPCEAAHEEIIGMLDKAGTTFRVLIIKTPSLVPYTSVFFELTCGYWTDAAEQRLRERMAASS